MGSSSWNQSVSQTTYTNTPVTQENVSNPLNLTNSTANLGSQISVGGNLTMNADAQAVGAAFDFGSKLVQVVADITRQNNVAAADAAKDETKAAADDKKAAAFDWKKYEVPAMLAGSVLVWWFVWGRKK